MTEKVDIRRPASPPYPALVKGGLGGFLEEMPGIQCQLSFGVQDSYSITAVPPAPPAPRDAMAKPIEQTAATRR
jgi:hypothetical protein